MKQYIISVMVVGVVGAIVTLLSPDGEGGGLKAHVRLGIGVVLILVCMSPLVDLVKTLGELDVHEIVGNLGDDEGRYESIFQSSYKAAEIENLKEGIRSILFDKFGVKPEECYVSVSWEDGGDDRIKLKRIFINYYGAAIMKNTSEIEDYLSSLFGCEVVSAVG